MGEDSLRYCAIYYTVLYSVYCAFFLDELTNLNILKKHLFGFIKSDKNRTKNCGKPLHLVFLE